MANHEILGGKVQVYRRTNKTWHCSASVAGVQLRASTKEEDLELAKEAAGLVSQPAGLSRAGLIKQKEIRFDKVADQFEVEYETITEGLRSPRWVEGHKHRLLAPTPVLQFSWHLRGDRRQGAGLSCASRRARRTAYSLRHIYICLRLMEGADIYQIAKNCRTSVEMIEKYYAAHIKNALDTSAINGRRPRRKGQVQPDLHSDEWSAI